MIALLIGGAAFLAVWILPGFGILAIAQRVSRATQQRSQERLSARLAEALILSAVAVAVFGGTLIAGGWFSEASLAILLLPFCLVGVLPFLRWLVAVARPVWRTIGLLGLGIPALWAATVGVLQPSHSFQWFYWELGRQLSSVGGVPAWVLEYGERVRWHPDYVFFSAGSEAYRWLTAGIDETAAIVAWRGPVALLGIVMAYAVLRLWISRPAAMFGAAAVSVTTFFLVKFNAYKPESLGVVIGLASVCLLVNAIRARRPGLLLLAGVGLGVDFGIHGIAATVFSLLAVAAGVVEWRGLPGTQRAWTLRPLVAGGALAVAIVVATGLGLQGRAVVASDATHPELRGDQDPTWTFLARHNGDFASLRPPGLGDRVIDSVTAPWPGTIVRDWAWLPLSIFAVGGLLLGVRGPPEGRRGAVAIGISLATLIVAGLFFAVAFDTYIPQHTGITRMGSYSYLIWGMGLAFLIDAILRGTRSRWGRADGRTLGWAALAFVLAWSIPVGVEGLSSRLEVSSTGEQALGKLRSTAGDDSTGAVLSNVSTRGIFEFEGRVENPIEGRQPVIEDPRFLRDANRVLAEAQDYFLTLGEPGTRDSQFLRHQGIEWLLVARRPGMLGSSYAFGNPDSAIAAAREEPGLRLAWRAPGVALFKASEASGSLERLGPVETRAVPWATALLLVVVTAGAAAALTARRKPVRPQERSDTDARIPLAAGRPRGPRPHRGSFGLWGR